MPIDYKEYSENWKEISWYIRFVRAGGACETCGAVNNCRHPVTWAIVVLTVAHIRHNKSDCRYNPEQYDPNDSENNLVAECQSCHLKRDAGLHAANRRFGRKRNGKHQLKAKGGA